MSVSITTIDKISNELESALWAEFWQCCDDGENVDDVARLDALIRRAPVVIKRENEHCGLWPTRHLADQERFVWVSRVTSGEHMGQCCMADETGDVEFIYMQE